MILVALARYYLEKEIKCVNKNSLHNMKHKIFCYDSNYYSGSIFTENSWSNSRIQLIILLVQRTYIYDNIWQWHLLLLQLSCCIFNYLTCTYISWKGCAQISFVKENILYMFNRYQKFFWKLVKILLELIIFYKMNTDNDTLFKFWFHLDI